MAQINQDLSGTSYDDIGIHPPGWDKFEVVDSEIRAGKESGVDYIIWKIENIGKFPGKVVWIKMFPNSDNDYGRKLLKMMATACGHKNPNYVADTEELHGKRFEGKMKISVDKNGFFDDSNDITEYRSLTKTVPGKTVSTPTPTPTAPALPIATPATAEIEIPKKTPAEPKKEPDAVPPAKSLMPWEKPPAEAQTDEDCLPF